MRRPGHRVEWIAKLLAPVRDEVDSAAYGRLSKALTLLLGIDPGVVMTDVAGATKEQAIDALAWTAQTLVEAALREKKGAAVRGESSKRR